MNITDRIKLLAEKEGLTITAIEHEIGASKGVLSRAVRTGTDIQSKWLSKIVDNYQLWNANWLLTGKGEMLITENKSDSPTITDQVSIVSDVVNTYNCKKVDPKCTCPSCIEKDKLINRLEHQLARCENDIDWFKNQLQNNSKNEDKSKRNSA
jgi:hypothetical protein